MLCQATGSTLKRSVGPSILRSEAPRVNRRLNVSPRGGKKQFLDRKEPFSLRHVPLEDILPNESGRALRFPLPKLSQKVSVAVRLYRLRASPSLSALLFPISSVLSALHEENGRFGSSVREGERAGASPLTGTASGGRSDRLVVVD